MSGVAAEADRKITMKLPTAHITLEQWRCLVAVVQAGGYAQAGELLHKSQSSISYSVQKMEEVLGLKVFSMEGRRAVLTDTGKVLYLRAQQLLEDSASLEQAASRISAGWESQIAIAVEVLFPTWLLFDCLERFGEESPHTHIEWYETVIEGGPELLREGRVDLAILPRVPAGFNGEALPTVTRFIPVAHPSHALHKTGRELSLRELRKHRNIVVRDTSSTREAKTDLTAQRWTVSNMSTSIGAVCRGHGYAWLPEDKIREELRAGTLKPLRLRGGQERFAQLYLIYPDHDAAGPGACRLADIIKQRMIAACKEG